MQSQRVTRITNWSNDISDQIEASSKQITTVIPRDTNTSVERYIIFTPDNVETLPPATEQVLTDLGFEVRRMDNHAIDYENKDTDERATFLAH